MTSDGAGRYRRVGGGTKAMLWATGFAAISLAGFVPGWWERRLYRQAVQFGPPGIPTSRRPT